MENPEKMIHDVAKRLIDTVGGGEVFFDKMDEFIRYAPVSLYSHALDKFPADVTLLISGGFGKTVAEFIDCGKLTKRPYILFEGGIRKSGKIEVIRSFGEFTDDVIFFDDTIYGGRTFYAIKDYVKDEYGLSADRCFVFYDGAPQKRDYVDSFFRYYDHYQAVPNFQF